MSAVSGSGQCACSSVAYRVDGKLRDVWYCHCVDCRRTTGHHMAATEAARDDVTLERDDTLTWFSRQPGVRYGFCRQCGSTLFWTADDRPGRLSISAGTLDQPTGLTTAGVLFRAEAADYISVHPDVPTEPYDSAT